MVDHKHYTYRVSWSEEDQEYVAMCAEFPSLSYLDDEHLDALKGMIRLIGDVVKDMKNNNEDIPEPIANKKYTGKFVVRIPPEQHRKLAIKAAEEGISLNRLVSSKLV